jgi:hypothetical protein
VFSLAVPGDDGVRGTDQIRPDGPAADQAGAVAIVIGVWLCLVGGITALVGLSARQRARTLRRDGVEVWATAVAGPDRTVRLRYDLGDGRVLDGLCPAGFRKPPPLPGEKVLAWYQPADPRELLVHGREGKLSDRLFMLTGALFILIGVGFAVLNP